MLLIPIRLFYLLQKTEADKPKETEEATDKDAKDKKAEGKDDAGEKTEEKKDGEKVPILLAQNGSTFICDRWNSSSSGSYLLVNV